MFAGRLSQREHSRNRLQIYSLETCSFALQRARLDKPWWFPRTFLQTYRRNAVSFSFSMCFPLLYSFLLKISADSWEVRGTFCVVASGLTPQGQTIQVSHPAPDLSCLSIIFLNYTEYSGGRIEPFSLSRYRK